MDRDALSQALSEGKTAEQIAEQFLVKKAKVWYWIRKYRLQTVRSKTDNGRQTEIVSQVRKKLRENKSLRLIAEETGRSYSAIRYIVTKAGVKQSAYPLFIRNGSKRQLLPEIVRDMDWKAIQNHYDNGGTHRSVRNLFDLQGYHIKLAIELGLFHLRTKSDALRTATKLGRVDQAALWTKKRRKAQSEQKKRLYAEHPEKHPNRKLADNRSKMSYPERLMYDALTAQRVRFEHNANWKPYWIDFLLDNSDIGIEVDGARWHDKLVDSARDTFLDYQYGIQIQRIPAKEILQNGALAALKARKIL